MPDRDPSVSANDAPPSVVGSVGAVVIGRNEGERLRRCLASLGEVAALVYVDSGSSDGSLAVAADAGAVVVRLDLSSPFTAARARNAGWARLQALRPGLRYVQFVDGDCQVADGWLSRALAHADAHPGVAAVCGRRKERHPEQSVYTLLCDIEWDTPVGDALACGGDVLMRASALARVGGFRPDLIAGEEPELCVRLRAAGWTIARIDALMTWHEADITRFSQWWRRTERAGYAFANGRALHGAPPERHWVRETRSARLWALAIPSVCLLGTSWVGAPGAALWLVYPLQWLRLARRADGPWRQRLARGFFLLLGKFAEMTGQCRYAVARLGDGPARLIEYK